LFLTAIASTFCWARATLAIQLERARLTTAPIDILTMFDIGNPILWIIGVPALGVLLFLLRGHFSAETRAQRRRGKSHRPVISRKPGPNVKLVVNVGKPKRDRKR
jgi:hypothetical protein